MPTPEEIIGSFYRAILGREPDRGGLRTYADELRNGASLDHILSVFVQSDEFMRRIDKRLAHLFTERTQALFPVRYVPPPNEAGKTYFTRRANGFFDRFLSGEKILDIGFKGYANPRKMTVVPHALGVDLDFPGYDGLRLPFDDETIDAVFSSHCLEHIASYQDAIRDWHRVLKIGGHIICAVPSQCLYEKKTATPSRFNEDHKRFYTPASLLGEFQESLAVNSYRIRHLEENDAQYDYTRGPETHAVGCYEIVLVLEKIRKPDWEFD
jgi:SAM-dependent methyltransferase